MSKVKYGLTLQKCLALGVAWDYADEQDKSTAWMLQYMQDVAGVELDAVIGGMVVMMTCTVQGAKERINDLIAGGEERAREKLVKAGIPIPEPEPTTLF